jgi:hypothetical protein
LALASVSVPVISIPISYRHKLSNGNVCPTPKSDRCVHQCDISRFYFGGID